MSMKVTSDPILLSSPSINLILQRWYVSHCKFGKYHFVFVYRASDFESGMNQVSNKGHHHLVLILYLSKPFRINRFQRNSHISYANDLLHDLLFLLAARTSHAVIISCPVAFRKLMIRRVVGLGWLKLGLLIAALLIVGSAALRCISTVVVRLADVITSASRFRGNVTFMVTRLWNWNRPRHRDEDRLCQSNWMRYRNWMRHRHRFRYQEWHLKI